MPDYTILLPSKPKVVSEEGASGVYEIDGLYPGYGHTLGNSLRRIILSSLPGAAVTLVKIAGVNHEFSTVEGVKEDVVTILLNLKKVRFKLLADEPQALSLRVKGPRTITAKDIKVPGQVEILTGDQYIAEIAGKNTELDIEMKVEKGLGYVAKEAIHKDKVEIGSIAVDAIFTPIRRVSYEVENMRVGDRTDYNRLRITIETDGTLSAREALERSIEIMIQQLRAIVGFKEESEELSMGESEMSKEADRPRETADAEAMKTRIDTLNFSTRTLNALSNANIRTIGGLARKKKEDLLSVDGLGEKGIQEIKRVLSNYGITLR